MILSSPCCGLVSNALLCLLFQFLIPFPPHHSIHKYASCSKECFILALIYIDRLIQRNNFLLTELNVHRVVITAVLLAAKFFDDAYYNNAYYAKVGGVLVEEMNNLECQFLFKIDFSLRVLPDDFEKYSVELISHSSAGGMDQISMCTDDELYRVPSSQQQVESQQVCHHSVVAVAPQAPLLQQQTYSQVEQPAVYANPAPQAAAPLEIHYPLQAIQRSVTAPGAAPQAHAMTHHQQQQQQTSSAHFDQVYHPFPNLAPQVSAHHEAQVAPSQNPAEIDLVYHNPMLVAAQAAAAHAHQQDVSLSQYHYPNGGYNTQQPEFDSVFHKNNHLNQAPVHQAAAPTEAPVYSQQHTNYFNNAGTALGVHQATHQQQHHPPMLQSHPEITPSPPPQPPINIHHGAPIAYQNGEVGFPVNLSNSMAYLKSTAAGASALHHHHADASSNYYSTPADAAVLDNLHHHHHHQQHQLHRLPSSRPIAIGNHHSAAQDNGNSWSCMLSLERGSQ